MLLDILVSLIFLIGTVSFVFGFGIALLAEELTTEGTNFVMKYLTLGAVLIVGAILIRQYGLI